jgi:hypothetical protein
VKTALVRSAAIASFLAASALTSPAGAAFDPNAAQAAAERALATSHYTFCDKPRLPLSTRARSLCGHAAEVASCAGFAHACSSPEGLSDRCVESRPTREDKDEPQWKIGAIWGQIARLVVWGLLAMLAVFVLVHLIASRRRAGRDRALADEVPDEGPPAAAPPQPPPTLDEEDLLSRAEQHVLAREYALALQLYLGAALRSLDRRGALRLGRDRTNGEYVRSCADSAARPLLREIVREVERVQFGREHPTEDRVVMTGRRAVAIVRSASAAVAIAALVLVTGCGSVDTCSRVEAAGDDPAGLELFHDVLEGQGYRVERLGRSLASLGEPEWWRGSAPVVVVDTDVVRVDDETWDHVTSWVTSGGTLILAGAPAQWPSSLQLTASRGVAGSLHVAFPPSSSEADEDDEPEKLDTGTVVRGNALTSPDDSVPVAWMADDSEYAAIVLSGTGTILALASDELLTNAGLARRGNAAAMTALFARLGRTDVLIAESDDGVAPPSSPVSSLMRAGLGLGLLHALAAAAILFLAAGIRLMRPRRASPPARRAFVEHVRAVGGLYARTSNAAHALAVYTRFAEERLRARMPRGTVDVPTFLAQRSSHPVEECRELWSRAVASRAGDPARGDELTVLKRLSALCAAAMGSGPSRLANETVGRGAAANETVQSEGS